MQRASEPSRHILPRNARSGTNRCSGRFVRLEPRRSDVRPWLTFVTCARLRRPTNQQSRTPRLSTVVIVATLLVAACGQDDDRRGGLAPQDGTSQVDLVGGAEDDVVETTDSVTPDETYQSDVRIPDTDADRLDADAAVDGTRPDVAEVNDSLDDIDASDTEFLGDADLTGGGEDAEDDSNVWVQPPPAPIGLHCNDHADCAFLERCDPLYHVCVECVASSDCGWDSQCHNGTCVGEGRPKCLTDVDCNSSSYGRVCLPGQMICGRCYEDWQCAPGQVCQANECVQGVSQSASCTVTIDCPEPLVCSGAGHCVQCETSAECGANESCLRWHCVSDSPPMPRYVPRICHSDNDCRDLGVDCDNELGLCSLGPICDAESGCPIGYHCHGNVCERDACRPGLNLRYCFSLCRDEGSCTTASGEATRFGVRECNSAGEWETVGVCSTGCSSDPTGYRSQCYDSSFRQCAPAAQRVDGCLNAYEAIRYSAQACLEVDVCQCSMELTPGACVEAE